MFSNKKKRDSFNKKQKSSSNKQQQSTSKENEVVARKNSIKRNSQQIKRKSNVASENNSLAETTSSTRKRNRFYKKYVMEYSGLLLALFATIFLSCSYFIMKLGKCLNVSEMSAVQFFITSICSLSVALCHKQNILGPANSRLMLILRGCSGSTALVLVFLSIQFISFGDSTVIRNTAPVVTAIFARIFLKEKLNISHGISLVVSMIGIVFIARPPFIFGMFYETSGFKFTLYFGIGIGLAIVSTFLIGTTYLFLKKLTNREVHFTSIIFYLTATGCIISIIISIIVYFTGLQVKTIEMVKAYILRDLGLAGLAGIINFFGHYCFISAMVKESTNTVSIMRTFDIVMAFLLEYFITLIKPSVFSLIGAALVILGVFIVVIYRIVTTQRRRKPKTPELIETTVFRV